MDADCRPETVKVRIAKRMPDGEVQHSAPLYDSSAGFARVGHMLTYPRRVRDGCEGGAFACRAPCKLDPDFLLRSYIAVAHQKCEQGGGSLPLETMAVGDGGWLGDIRVVEEVVVDLDSLLVDDAAQRKSGWEWTC